MSLPEEDAFHYKGVVEDMLDGVVVPFLGAGANLCGRPDKVDWEIGGQYMPSGTELARWLAAQVDYPDHEDRDLMRISQYAEAKLKQGKLYRRVRSTLDAPYPPTDLHKFLARLAGILRQKDVSRQVILTTNYDDALERAFKDRGEPYEVIWYEANGPDAGHFVHLCDRVAKPIDDPNNNDEIDPEEITVIVKLHGAMVREVKDIDSYVITEDDYVKYLTRSDISVQLPTLVRSRISGGALLFMGYSMRDWNLRVVLERLMGNARLSESSISVQRKPTRPSSEMIERTLWKSREIELKFVLLDEYVRKLDAELERVGISVS